jgi:hypothetical protein
LAYRDRERTITLDRLDYTVRDVEHDLTLAVCLIQLLGIEDEAASGETCFAHACGRDLRLASDAAIVG